MQLAVNFFSERVKMEVTAVEEKCDRRIELLTQSVKKSRKRARIERIEEDDEEWVPSVFLHAEQTKVRVGKMKECCAMNVVHSDSTLTQGSHRSWKTWKVMEFYNFIF